jgi:hypothetical protein
MKSARKPPGALHVKAPSRRRRPARFPASPRRSRTSHRSCGALRQLCAWILAQLDWVLQHWSHNHSFLDSFSILGARAVPGIGMSADVDSGKADAPLRSSTYPRQMRKGRWKAPLCEARWGASYAGGTARTGDGATWSKRFVTLPNSRPEIGPCPRVPTTIRSAPTSFAASAIAWAAPPAVAPSCS